MSQERLLYIDKLKAIAMMLVVMGHTMYFCMYHEQSASDPLLNIICTFHVPLFFWLSGYVISCPPTFRKFLAKARRFLVPMLVVGLVNALVFGGVSLFLFNGGHFGYWYLLTLTIFYLLLVPFRYFTISRFHHFTISRFHDFTISPFHHFAIGEKKRRMLAFVVDAALALAVWLLLYAAHTLSAAPSSVLPSFLTALQPFLQALNAWGAFAFWPFFVIGYMSRKYALVAYITRKPWIALLLVSAYLVLVVASFSRIDSLPIALDFVIALTAISALVAVFHLFDSSTTFIDRQLLLIGNNTLRIYLYHYFFIRCIDLGFLTGRSLLLELLVTASLTVVICYLSMAVGGMVKRPIGSSKNF